MVAVLGSEATRLAGCDSGFGCVGAAATGLLPGAAAGGAAGLGGEEQEGSGGGGGPFTSVGSSSLMNESWLTGSTERTTNFLCSKCARESVR